MFIANERHDSLVMKKMIVEFKWCEITKETLIGWCNQEMNVFFFCAIQCACSKEDISFRCLDGVKEEQEQGLVIV